MLRKVSGIGVCFALSSACAAASMVIKAPVEQRCASVGLRGCAQVVDGVVAYLNGDKQLAERELRAGVAQNTPEEVHAFARLLVEVSQVPGASDYAQPINEVASLLLGEMPAGSASMSTPVPSSPAAGGGATEAAVPGVVAASGETGTKEGANASNALSRESLASTLALHALVAAVDPSRVRTETVSWDQVGEVNACAVAGAVAQCSPRRQGPLFVTDVTALTGCAGRMFLGAVVPSRGSMGLSWFVEATPSALTGARLFVGGGEWLVAMFVPSPKMDARDPRCALTWSGFRPKVIPSGLLPANYGNELEPVE